MLTTSELSFVRPSPDDHVAFSELEFRALFGAQVTSACDFDVGARQADGRHAHVEAHVVVEHEALAGRRAVLQQRLFLDANRRLRALFVLVAAVSLVVVLSLAAALRVTLLVLRDETTKNKTKQKRR